jgi:hypothetical protein
MVPDDDDDDVDGSNGGGCYSSVEPLQGVSSFLMNTGQSSVIIHYRRGHQVILLVQRGLHCMASGEHELTVGRRENR